MPRLPRSMHDHTWTYRPRASIEQLALFLLCAVCWSVGCTKRNSPVSDRFIQLDSTGFMLRGAPYFPLVVNYVASLTTTTNGSWVGPTTSYSSYDPSLPISRTRDSLQLVADMQLIRDMGFNTVRVVGLSEPIIRPGGTFLRTRNALGHDTLVSYEHLTAQPGYTTAITQLLDACRSAGLRVILLMQLRGEVKATDALFARIADRFVEDTIILAYDLFNEPLYFDSLERTKEDAHGLLTHWRKLFDRHAPNQLYTIGLTGIRETFEFDPAMLQVDFISFHPYEYEPDQVRNEFRWYHDAVRVPWIVGETAVPADGDSIPFSEQFGFAERTLKQARACGALGYSWWQFQDVLWGKFHADHMGLLDRKGTTTTSTGLDVPGSIKPVVQAFRDFDPSADPGPCLCMPNHANYSAGEVCAIEGRLVDQLGDPIAHGTVMAWNQYWSSSYHTSSDSNGYFVLRGPERLFHWMASASGHIMLRGECDPRGFRSRGKERPTWQLGSLPLRRLDFLGGQ